MQAFFVRMGFWTYNPGQYEIFNVRMKKRLVRKGLRTDANLKSYKSASCSCLCPLYSSALETIMQLSILVRA